MTPDPMPRPTEDELVACYHEAAALQGAGPSADLRAAVLAQAEVTAWKHADAAENPDEIAIDVTELSLGQSIRVGDINVEGIEILNQKSVPVATVMVTRAARAAMNVAAKGK